MRSNSSLILSRAKEHLPDTDSLCIKEEAVLCMSLQKAWEGFPMVFEMYANVTENNRLWMFESDSCKGDNDNIISDCLFTLRTTSIALMYDLKTYRSGTPIEKKLACMDIEIHMSILHRSITKMESKTRDKEFEAWPRWFRDPSNWKYAEGKQVYQLQTMDVFPHDIRVIMQDVTSHLKMQEDARKQEAEKEVIQNQENTTHSHTKPLLKPLPPKQEAEKEDTTPSNTKPLLKPLPPDIGTINI